MRLYVSFIFLFISLGLCAQFSEIKPGVVLPQMTTSERTSIASPVNGMLVFDSNTQSYWFRQSGSWVELNASGGSSHWKLNGLGGNEIKNTNSGGFWSENLVGLDNSSNDISNPPIAPVNGNGTRLMWIPSRSAFRVGTVHADLKGWDADSIGLGSFAAGYNAKATGRNTASIGSFTHAKANYSIAMGYSSDAFGQYSTAMGAFTLSDGNYASSMGYRTEALGASSIAGGRISKAIGDYSIAMGDSVEAYGSSAVGLGHETFALGESSAAIGHNVVALGTYSTAMGDNSVAWDSSSTALGGFTSAKGKYSTSMGKSTKADGDYSTAFGRGTLAEGTNSFAIGRGTTASGQSSSAMGDSTIASGLAAVAMGDSTTASGNYSTAIGRGATAGGAHAVAIGRNVTANGNGTVIIGDGNPGGLTYTSGTHNKFIGRFYNGYYLLTSATGETATGVSISHGQTAWSSISDSTKKEDFILANGNDFLMKLKSLKLGSWNYKTQDENPERFYGPMAQEIFAAYGKDAKGTIGSDTLVSTLNMDGLLFIFAQALEERTANLKKKNDILRNEVDTLKEKYEQGLVVNENLKNDFERRLVQIENLLSLKNNDEVPKQILTSLH